MFVFITSEHPSEVNTCLLNDMQIMSVSLLTCAGQVCEP